MGGRAGESVPKNGTFFYNKNSNLFKAMLEVFSQVYVEINQVNFLEKFKNLGCYLEDLCEEPVNGKSDIVRQTLRKLYEPSLKKKILQFNPKILIYTPKTYLNKNIVSIKNDLNLSIPIYGLAFPGRPNHKIEFIEELRKILSNLNLKYQ